MNNTGVSLADIVECELSPCNESATCSDTDGSFECTCTDGYSGDGFNCTSQSQIMCTLEHFLYINLYLSIEQKGCEC